jgi:hypothetical protein
MTIRLRQGQLWKQGDTYIRIVQLERLEVGYKTLAGPTSKEGTAHRVSKKEFCRLLKNAEWLPLGKKPSGPQASSQSPVPDSQVRLSASRQPTATPHPPTSPELCAFAVQERSGSPGRAT